MAIRDILLSSMRFSCQCPCLGLPMSSSSLNKFRYKLQFTRHLLNRPTNHRPTSSQLQLLNQFLKLGPQTTGANLMVGAGTLKPTLILREENGIELIADPQLP